MLEYFSADGHWTAAVMMTETTTVVLTMSPNAVSGARRFQGQATRRRVRRTGTRDSAYGRSGNPATNNEQSFVHGVEYDFTNLWKSVSNSRPAAISAPVTVSSSTRLPGK